MHTDDLKTLWKEETERIVPRTPPDILRRMTESRWRDSRSALIRKLTIEFTMMITVMLLVGWVTFVWVPEVTVFSMSFFLLACMILLPSMVMFVVQIRKWRRLDYARDTRAHARMTIAGHRRIIRLYLVLSYAFCGIMTVFLTLWPFDEPAPELPFRIGFIAWCLFGIVIARPYARWMFGRDVDRLEHTLHELESIDADKPEDA